MADGLDSRGRTSNADSLGEARPSCPDPTSETKQNQKPKPSEDTAGDFCANIIHLEDRSTQGIESNFGIDQSDEFLDDLSAQLIEGDLLQTIELNQADPSKSCLDCLPPKTTASQMATQSVMEYLSATGGGEMHEEPIIPQAQFLLHQEESWTPSEVTSTSREVHTGQAVKTATREDSHKVVNFTEASDREDIDEAAGRDLTPTLNKLSIMDD